MSRTERRGGPDGNRRPRMRTCFLGGLTTLAVLVVAALATTASGRPGRTDLGGVGRPTIDGTLAAGEWSKAGRLDFMAPIAKNAGGGAAAATLLVMNDETSLFVALRIGRSTGAEPGGTSATVIFDPVSGLADWLAAYWDDQGWHYRDGFCETSCTPGAGGGFDTSFGGNFDIEGAAVSTPAETTIEFSHPLNSPDRRHDFSLKPGDSVGFTLYLNLTCHVVNTPDCAQPNTVLRQTLVVAAPPARAGVISRAWMSLPGRAAPVGRVRRATGLQANFVFGLRPIAGSTLQVRWFVNGKAGRAVPKDLATRVTSTMFSAPLANGRYKAVLSVRPPGGSFTPVGSARATVG